MNYRIGYVAQQIGVQVQTLRRWVEAGLVPCSYRTPGNRYLFTEDDLLKIRNILLNKENPKDGDTQ